MFAGKRWLLSSVLVLAGCASDDRSSRPPLVPPAPPQDVINVAGFDDAMHVGSDYIYASKLPDRVFIGSQELPGNLWLLRFGPGAQGGAPVDLVVDTKNGTVVKDVPAGAEAELKSVPGLGSPRSDTPSAPPPPPPEKSSGTPMYPMPSDAPSLQE
jgi:hypothetical protein